MLLSRKDWQPWVVCLSGGLFFFYEFFQLNLFDVINNPLREAFNINATWISWMSSAYLWADVLFLLPAGIILDRFSTRLVIFYSMLLCVLGTLGFALTSSFFVAFVCHFLSGIGNAFCFLACIVLVSRWFPPRRQAFVVGCLVTMAFLGGTMAHTPMAYLNEHYGWRQALIIDAIVGFVFLLWLWFIIQDYPSGHEHTKPRAMTWGDMLKGITNPQNWFAGFYTSLLNLPILVLCALWGASYLNIVHNLSNIAASNVISLVLIGSIVGCPIVGFISDKMGRRKPLMLFGAIISLLLTLPLVMDIDLSEAMLSTLFFLLGFFTSTQIVTYPVIVESNPPTHTGSATGIASMIIMGGGAIAQVLFGMLMQYHANPATTYARADYQFAMWMFPIAILLALGAVFMIRETYCQKN